MKKLLIGLFLCLLTIGGADGKQNDPEPLVSYSMHIPPVVHSDHGGDAHTTATKRHHHLRKHHQKLHRELIVPRDDASLVTVPTDANIVIRVASTVANQFQGFISDLVKQGYTPQKIDCWAPEGTHVWASNHYHGGACDIDQKHRGQTAPKMYHVGDLAAKWGLRDGCSFGDCGHIDDGKNVGWKHPHNILARYIDQRMQPRVAPLHMEGFEE